MLCGTFGEASQFVRDDCGGLATPEPATTRFRDPVDSSVSACDLTSSSSESSSCYLGAEDAGTSPETVASSNDGELTTATPKAKGGAETNEAAPAKTLAPMDVPARQIPPQTARPPRTAVQCSVPNKMMQDQTSPTYCVTNLSFHVTPATCVSSPPLCASAAAGCGTATRPKTVCAVPEYSIERYSHHENALTYISIVTSLLMRHDIWACGFDDKGPALAKLVEASRLQSPTDAQSQACLIIRAALRDRSVHVEAPHVTAAVTRNVAAYACSSCKGALHLSAGAVRTAFHRILSDAGVVMGDAGADNAQGATNAYIDEASASEQGMGSDDDSVLLRHNCNENGEEPTTWGLWTASGHNFAHRIHRAFQCTYPVFVIAVIYLERMLDRMPHKMVFNREVSSRLVVVALIVAAKFFDDPYFSNEHYGSYMGFDLDLTNEMEVAMMQLLDFDLKIGRDELQRRILEFDRQRKRTCETESRRVRGGLSGGVSTAAKAGSRPFFGSKLPAPVEVLAFVHPGLLPHRDDQEGPLCDTLADYVSVRGRLLHRLLVGEALACPRAQAETEPGIESPWNDVQQLLRSFVADHVQSKIRYDSEEEYLYKVSLGAQSRILQKLMSSAAKDLHKHMQEPAATLAPPTAFAPNANAFVPDKARQLKRQTASRAFLV